MAIIRSLIAVFFLFLYLQADAMPKDSCKSSSSFNIGGIKIIDPYEISLKDILATINQFYKEFKGGREFLQKADGYLVFPNIYKAGFIIGGSYGIGALVIDGKITKYYKMYSTSVGFQIGVQKRSLIIVFLTKEALNNFLNKSEWKVGVDGSISILNWNKGTDINSIDMKKDIVAIPFNSKGIMVNLTLEGTVFQQIR
ncbi:MAG: hypothetical protein GXO02_02595 [Epsilonproteobacteria bacterium]|nr:hypothetical protein [Campylobacterota bacterium]